MESKQRAASSTSRNHGCQLCRELRQRLMEVHGELVAKDDDIRLLQAQVEDLQHWCLWYQRPRARDGPRNAHRGHRSRRKATTTAAETSSSTTTSPAGGGAVLPQYDSNRGPASEIASPPAP